MLERAQLVVSVLTLAAVVWLGLRQGQLEARMAVLERPAGAAAVASLDERAPAVRASRVAAQALRSAPRGPAAANATAVAEEVDDVLWSDDGRAAIGDVLEEREADERQRQRQRWEKLRQHRTERMLDEVAGEVGLDDEQVEELAAIIEEYSATRSALWEAMSSDEDVDLAQLEAQSEQAGEDAEAAIVKVGGEATLEALQSRWGGRGR